jgi:predicted ATPase
VTTLTINRLTRREVDAMIDRVIGNKLLTADVRQDIVERTAGMADAASTYFERAGDRAAARSAYIEATAQGVSCPSKRATI